VENQGQTFDIRMWACFIKYSVSSPGEFPMQLSLIRPPATDRVASKLNRYRPFHKRCAPINLDLIGVISCSLRAHAGSKKVAPRQGPAGIGCGFSNPSEMLESSGSFSESQVPVVM
jgi:hypothetical protein